METFLKTDKNGQITDWSERAENILGFKKEEIVGEKITKLKPRPRFPKIVQSADIYLRSKTGVDINFQGEVLKNGDYDWLIYQKSAGRTELNKDALVTISHDALISVDLKRRITGWNKTASDFYHLDESEVVEKRAGDILGKEIDRQISLAMKNNQPLSEFYLDNKVFKRSLLLNIVLIEDVNKRLIGASIALKDVSREALARREAKYLAEHDPLTGLINRDCFLKEIEEKKSVTLITLDIDHFRLINESFGHKKGDLLLQGIANFLKDFGKNNNLTVAYLGADEFAVLTNLDEKQALKQADFLIKEMSLAGKEILKSDLSLSAGVFKAKRNQSAEEIITASESALFEAKETGRGQSVQYKKESQLKMANQLKRSLLDESLLIYKQPIANIQEQRIDRFELLLRVKIEDKLVSPEPFLKTASRLGLAEDVDMFVIEKGVEFASKNNKVEINLSGGSLNSPRVIQKIQDQINKSGANPKNIIFEITEIDAVKEFDQAVDFIKSLNNIGCQFILDDFGTGFSSFSYLKNLPVDGVKIDGDFIKNITNSTTDQKIVEAIVMISQALNKETVAEWVKDQKTLDMLKDIGVDYAQGYFIGRPVLI
jgi:diguanylate cyclase (GGDEF)-like protein/PAS domain S-box-containing protein